jgi:hypothetical protein
MERPSLFSGMSRFAFKYLIVFAVVVLGTFMTASSVHAATKYWIGPSGGNFSSNSNWSTSSGGANNTTHPGTSDVATFDGGDVNNATLDSTVDVAGMDIRSDGGGSGYTGTITENTGVIIDTETSGWSQAAGTFTGSAAAIGINAGTFALSGGTFTSTSGTLTIVSTFTISGGTFNANSGTVSFTIATKTVTTGGATFNNVNLGITTQNGTITLADDMTVAGNLTTDGNTTNGHIAASGTRTVNLAGNFTAQGANFGDSGTLTLNLNGTGTQTLSETNGGNGLGNFEAALILAKGSGSVVLGTNFEMVGGKALTINGSNTLDASPDGGTTSYNLTIDSSANGSFSNSGTFNGRA